MASDKLSPGQSLIKDFTVEETHTAAHLGSGAIQVLATPMMIAFMENVALELIGQSLPEGFSSVGTRVDVRHLAPTPLGASVQVTAAITQVDGASVSLDVTAHQGETLIGTGTHKRYIIEVARFMERLQEN